MFASFLGLAGEWMVNSAPGTKLETVRRGCAPVTIGSWPGEAARPVEGERSASVRKQDLIREVANETGLTESQATKAVNAFLTAIHNGLAQNDEVSISGFGSFKVVERAGREGRNPRTGEPMKIAARRSPTFKPGTQLKRAVEGDA
jgi:DNA-binding protein HU-beta